jgi:alpha-D-xyloside xylohydrolase
MIQLLTFFTLSVLLAPLTHALTITLTPWCANSFRVQIEPSSPSTGHTAATAALKAKLESYGLTDLPAALISDCGPGAPVAPTPGSPAATNGNLAVSLTADGTLTFTNALTSATLFSAALSLGPGVLPPYLAGAVVTTAGNVEERFFGLGQGNWTDKNDNGCPIGENRIVPLERNGQTVSLQQQKFDVAIPFVYSTAGYGFLFNMPGAGTATMGVFGVGGMQWRADAALGLDFWVTAGSSSEVYSSYADATGHAPPLREDAMLFWQSRLRYKSSAIALDVAARYAQLDLPVGVLVIDFYNQRWDGDFAPNSDCFPSVSNLTAALKDTLNATLVFSFWPEVLPNSSNSALFTNAGCLSNADLGGRVIDATIPSCREIIWSRFFKPNYYDQGVTAVWLDETDGEGTDGGDGTHGYDTSFGPAIAYSQLWVGAWISTFAHPVAVLGEYPPLVLTRGVWAGGQRYGTVLWSSDIESTFETLAAMVPQGVHASMSGIPWFTTDVGGFGCSHHSPPSNGTYMQELIVRWYAYGMFCPIFRTHGCRSGPSEPEVAPCINVAGSCGSNEVWAYGDATQALLEVYVRFRAEVLKPYIAELSKNVSAFGVPTLRPLLYEFPEDPACVGVSDQFMLGPVYLVAPVTVQGATNRSVVFPAGAKWQSVWDESVVEEGGVVKVVQAPLAVIPAYRRI